MENTRKNGNYENYFKKKHDKVTIMTNACANVLCEVIGVCGGAKGAAPPNCKTWTKIRTLAFFRRFRSGNVM